MKQVYIEDLEERIKFVQRAAERFAKEPGLFSYTDGPLEPGCYLALRWGLGDDCVLLLKLDDNLEPEVYGQVIPGDPPPIRRTPPDNDLRKYKGDEERPL